VIRDRLEAELGIGFPGAPRCEASTTVAPWSSALPDAGQRGPRMRVSSVIRPFLNRDVEIHAHEPRLPFRSRSLIDNFATGTPSRVGSSFRLRARQEPQPASGCKGR